MKPILTSIVKILALFVAVILATIIAVKNPCVLSVLGVVAWVVGGVHVTAQEIKKIR